MDLSARMTRKQLGEFVDFIEGISDDIGFKVSSRGWGYILEQRGMITKDQFDKVEGVINRCRREGLLSVDFVAEEAARAFSNVEVPTGGTHAAHVRDWVEASLRCHQYFIPDWWEGEDVYIQMVVEKIDPRGRNYYWIGGDQSSFGDIEHSDVNAVLARQVAITPLKVDIVDYPFLERMRGWKI